MTKARTARIGMAAAGMLLAWLAGFGQAPRVYRDGSFWVEDTAGTFPAGRSVQIVAALGTILVDGTGGSGVSYSVHKRVCGGSEAEARQQFENYRFNARRMGDRVLLAGELASRQWRCGGVQIAVHAPNQQDSVRVVTHGGDLTIHHLTSRVEASSMGGNATLDDIAGPVLLSLGGGTVRIGSVRGDLQMRSGGSSVTVENVAGNASVNTGGGVIDVGRVDGNLFVKTGGGNIAVRSVGGSLSASTGGGSLDLGDVGGPVIAETGGGGIRLRSGGRIAATSGAGAIQCNNVKRGLQAATAAGGIVAEFNGARSDFAASHLDAGMGDIVVYLPGDLGVRVLASIDFANGHTIQSDFSGLRVTQSEGPGPQEMHAEGVLNGGGPLLNLHTTTGNIVLRRTAQH